MAGDGIPIPPPLLEAIAHHGGGRVVLVAGAGCSVEPPTSLPLAAELARECNRRLLTDGVMSKEACENPDDLSCVADATVAATGSQRPLVDRFPPERFRNAQPNEGHLIAAALLREGALSAIMTLNFDLAQSTALAMLGAVDVATIRGPEDHDRLALRNLIYLHRNIDAPPDDLILRTEVLAHEWRDHWEEVVANRVMTSAVTVFAGLGSPSAVLVETTKRILGALGETSARTYVVGPTAPDESAFFNALELPQDEYLQVSWGEFMRPLGQRVASEQLAALELACGRLTADHEWDAEDVGDLCHRLSDLGLLALGKLRARWMLQEGSYLPNQDPIVPLMGDLLLAIAMIERLTGVRARFYEEGVLEFEREGRPRTAVLVASGGGYMRWALVRIRIDARRKSLGQGRPFPSLALVSGVVGARIELATPADIVTGGEEETVVMGVPRFEAVSVDELRANPSLAEELVS